MRTRRFLLFAILFIASATCSANNNSPKIGKTDSVYIFSKSQVDSIFNKIYQLNELKETSYRYISVLEKTNNQLSLWWNPYGVFIALIGILITLLAIGATVIIFHLNSNYRKMHTEAIANYSAVIDGFIKEKKADLDIKIKDTEDKIATAGKEQKKILESELEEFRKVRENLSNSFMNTPTMPAGSMGTYIWPTNPLFSMPASGSVVGMPIIMPSWDKKIKCSNCQKEFNVSHPSSRFVVPSGTVIAKCPYCGHSNTVDF